MTSREEKLSDLLFSVFKVFVLLAGWLGVEIAGPDQGLGSK